jgi:hypothetical protein
MMNAAPISHPHNATSVNVAPILLNHIRTAAAMAAALLYTVGLIKHGVS